MTVLDRAYSFFDIKSIEEDARIIEGVATTPTPDRARDVVNPLGAKFTLPLPYLWQHRHDEPVGHVIDARPNKNGIPFRAKFQKTEELGRLKDRLDEAWQSVKLKLVRANSIGFRPIKYSFLDDGGVNFEEWEWLELSGVTIPMQPDAAITAIKSFDRVLRAAEGVIDAAPPVPTRSDSDLIPAAPGKRDHVVKLTVPARSRAPFVIKRIVHTR